MIVRRCLNVTMVIVGHESNGGSNASRKEEEKPTRTGTDQRAGTEAGSQRLNESIHGLDREAQEPQSYGFYRGRRIHRAYRS